MDDCTHDIMTRQREAYVRRTLERRRPGTIHQASWRARAAGAVRRLADSVDSRPAGTTAPTRPM
ncbi:hypothetical protein KV100_08290 [Mumia sp. zg.B21]|uniref:hypothetical protein n=1 Tax=unclassified Mumia TaxID=2621872 RepID=UPI001C6EA6EC|nr:MULTISPECIES: hypothetical protein [unclassified Mumia]MBW9209654.1 hypothetical protein [Mumia sp. zg.B21]MDD9348060.1 hypothetical protein [Mumia sp.]